MNLPHKGGFSIKPRDVSRGFIVRSTSASSMARCAMDVHFPDAVFQGICGCIRSADVKYFLA
jgi:hypothetical protein